MTIVVELAISWVEPQQTSFLWFGPVLYIFGMSWNWLQFQFEPKVGKNWTEQDLQTLLISKC